MDAATYAISEWKHYEETNGYLLLGNTKALLIDSGLGVENIRRITDRLTTLAVEVVATHVPWDHIGSHGSFDTVLVHEMEKAWLDGGFPLPFIVVKQQLLKEPCVFPENFDVEAYRIYQGTATGVLRDGDVLDLGDRHVEVIHTPGHSPGHMCFLDKERGWLYSGDLIYQGMLFCDYPSTDPDACLQSVRRIRTLPVTRILPAHHTMGVTCDLIQRTVDAWESLYDRGKLHHGSGEFHFGDVSIRL